MVIQSNKVWHKEEFQPLQVHMENNHIARIAEYNKVKVDKDYGDSMIIPGLVDIHTHGYLGLDCNHATIDWLDKWLKYLPSEGVTSVAASTTSICEDTLLTAMSTIADFMESHESGAGILGIYAEGPLINPKFRGAQNEKAIVAPSPEILQKYENTCRGKLIYCCIAPEMDQNFETIRYAASKGIKIGIGHSGASFETCVGAKEAGAKSFVHTFNGMPPLHHREPGPVGAAMYLEDMYAEVIGDGVHVDLNAINVLSKLKGKDKLILVTDSAQIKGLPQGEYHMPGGRHVFLGEDGIGRLPNGTIAGSTCKMVLSLKNLIIGAKLDIKTAINAATINPLRMLGFDKCKGIIDEGYDADIVVLNEDYAVRCTFVGGQVVFSESM